MALTPAAAFAANYLPGQTLNPSCLPTDPTCLVVPPSATNVAAVFSATSTTATSTFASGISVSGVASSTNVVVSNTLTIGTSSGILRAIAGVVQTTLVNLSSDVTGVLGIANGGTGISSAPSYGQVLVGNASGGYNLIATSSLGIAGGGASLSSANTWTALQTFGSGYIDSASSTHTALTSFSNASSSLTTFTGSTWFSGIANAILSTNGSGQVVATTSIGTNYLTGNVTSINGTSIPANGSATITAASSTLLANSNTFSGLQIFSSGYIDTASSTHTAFTQFTSASTTQFTNSGNTYLTNLPSALLSTNSNGQVVATTSIGTNLLTGTVSSTNGGTGQNAYSTGDLLYASAPNTLSRLPIGTGGQVLEVAGGVPIWAANIGSGGGAGAWATTTNNLALYPATPSQVVLVGTSATSTTGNILETVGNSLFRGLLTAYNTVTAPSFTATSTTVASQFPEASSTNFTVSGTAWVNALNVTGATSTFASGINLSSGCFSVGGTCITGGGGGGSGTVSSGTQGQFAFYNAAGTTLTGTSSVFLSQSGNFGIGTTSPVALFTVSGGDTRLQETTDSRTALVVANAAGTSTLQVSTLNSSSNLFEVATSTGTAYLDVTSGGNIGIGSTTPGSTLGVAGSQYLTGGLGVGLVNNTAGTLWTTGNVLAGGNVGIGTTTPLTALSIQGTPGANDLLNIASSTGASLLYINAAGNVGIGTSTPGSLFAVQGVANWTTSTSTYYTTGGINLTAGCFSVNGTCITGGGGSSQWTTSGPNISFTGGNVGIGTTSPGSVLSVAGNSYFAGNLNLDQFSSYQLAGQTVLAATSTTKNTLVGLLAGANFISTSTSNTSAQFETALGYGALQFATSSQNDVAIGYDALRGQSGNDFQGQGDNVAVGASALATNSGNTNTAVGFSSLFQNTSGSQNSAFGYSSLFANTTGTKNSTFGQQSLDNNTTGQGNTSVGYRSEAGNISGSNNVAIGLQSLYTASTTSNNTAVGESALQGLTTGGLTISGINNTALGFSALLNYVSYVSGSNNTALGYQAGLDLSSGSNNIIIGANVDAPVFSGSRQLDIGNLLYGTNIYNGGSTSSTPVAGQVGIGTTTPFSTLEVWGPDTASTTAFSVVNSASTTVFATYDNGNATYSGSIFQSSDQRLKTDITDLDSSTSLALVNQLNPVSYTRIDQPDQGTDLGFIAQQVQQIFPELVSTSSPTTLTPDGTLTLDYQGLIAPLVKAVQALSSEITTLQNTVAGFAQSFTTHQLNADQLCLDGTCLSQQQLAAILASESQSSSGNSSPSSGGGGMASSSPDTPPVIQINGNNPAVIHVGDVYQDGGATITGPQADLNLDILTYLNGILTTNDPSVDTSTVATDTIDYVVTDQNGLTSTSTRTVVIEASSTDSQ